MPEAKAVHRILVAMDASPCSLAALEAAARLAAESGAELLGLYVEDEALLKGAELPLTRVVGSSSGEVRPIGRPEIEQQLRAHAERARRAMEAVALRSHLRWSFRVLRGSVPASLGAASADADIMTLGWSGWALSESGLASTRKMGRTTAALLASEGAPVLLLDRNIRQGRAVVAVYDDQPGSRAALDLGRVLARNDRTPFVVVLRGSESRIGALENQAENDLKQMGMERRVQFYALGRNDPVVLTRLNRTGGIGVLILPRPDALGKEIAELLAELRCPVLILRRSE